jgi:adenylate kinase
MSLTKSVPVIAISGLAGSGKTTLGHACARAWAGIVVDLDDLALELTAQALAHHRDASQALAAIRDERYAELYERIRQERVPR